MALRDLLQCQPHTLIFCGARGAKAAAPHDRRPGRPAAVGADTTPSRDAPGRRLVRQLHFEEEFDSLPPVDCGVSGMLVATWSGSLCGGARTHRVQNAVEFAFGRTELRRSASAFIDGLLSGVARKTGWQLAEQAGLERPYRLQSLLGRSAWQADTLRDLVRADVLATLGDAGGVLVVDETGFLKKGTHSVGVARQYSGTTGRVENCQVGVFVAYASRFGETLIDGGFICPRRGNDAARRRSRPCRRRLPFRPSRRSRLR